MDLDLQQTMHFLLKNKQLFQEPEYSHILETLLLCHSKQTKPNTENAFLLFKENQLSFIYSHQEQTLTKDGELSFFHEIIARLTSDQEENELLELESIPYGKVEVAFGATNGNTPNVIMLFWRWQHNNEQYIALCSIPNSVEYAKVIANNFLKEQNDYSEADFLDKGLQACEMLTKSFIGYFHIINEDQETISLQHWSANTKRFCKVPSLDSHYPISKAGIWVDCLRQGKAVFHNQYQKAKSKKGLPEGHLPLSRDLSVPIYDQNRVVAIVGVGNKLQYYNQTDIDVITILTNAMWKVIRKKKTEQKQQLQLRRSSKIIAHAPHLLGIVQVDGTILECNEAASSFFNKKQDELIGANAFRLLPEEISNFYQTKIWNCIQTGSVEPTKKQFYVNKKFIWLKISLQKIGDKCVSIVIQNVSNTELTAKMLQESENDLHVITESNPDIILRIDSQLRATYANKIAQQILGPDFEVRYSYLDSILKEEFLISLQKLIEKASTTQTKQQSIIRMFVNEQTYYYEWIVIPETDSGDLGQSYLVFARNVSMQKFTEHQLIVAKEKAEESSRLKSAFLANVSHEIRTPLNGIVGYAQMLVEMELPYNKQAQYINHIVGNSNQLLQLITDIVDLSKIEAGQIDFQIEKGNLNATLREIYEIASQKLQLQKKKISLSVDLAVDDEQANFRLDTSRFQQIMDHLLDNAIKFTNSGQVEFGYKIQPNEELVFFVRDTGAGISEEHFDIIFENFRQINTTATNHMLRGTGMGLSIAKNLVELYGGEIWVESIVGSGSIFYFTYSYFIDEKIRNGNPLANSLSLDNKRILIVDDTPTQQFLLEQIIRSAGATTNSVSSGYDALQLIKSKQQFDLIVLNIHLQDVNGLSLSKTIKEICPTVPIIAQTAFHTLGGRNKALLSGCDEYISKPIVTSQLFNKIHKLIRS